MFPELTGMVPAAPRCASAPPAALEGGAGPETGPVLVQGIWAQVADLQT